jgi:hypothetical protein
LDPSEAGLIGPDRRTLEKARHGEPQIRGDVPGDQLGVIEATPATIGAARGDPRHHRGPAPTPLHLHGHRGRERLRGGSLMTQLECEDEITGDPLVAPRAVQPVDAGDRFVDPRRVQSGATSIA